MTEYANIVFLEDEELRVGTDCSGIEAPIQALQQLGIPHRHVWSSDIDKYCIQSIKANYEPEILFGDPDGPYPDGDITKRDVSLLPDIDLYIAGFPCQPFSTAGKRKGFDHKSGNVFWGCLEVIQTKQPKYFILENVRGLLNHDTGNTWKVIWEELCKLKDYSIQWKILNTRDYGIPHNRPRLYIVGTKKEFEWPKLLPLEDVKTYIDTDDNKRYKTTERHEGIFGRLKHGKIFIELAFGVSGTREYINASNYSSCITTKGSMWCVPKHRYANTTELARLQGFPDSFNQVVSNTQMKKQIGNSMSVNVVRELIKCLL